LVDIKRFIQTTLRKSNKEDKREQT